MTWPLFGYDRGPHPLPAGERRPAAVPGTVALHRRAAARVPAGRRRRHASTSSTTTASRSRSTPTPARRSGSGGSAASTPPRPPTTGAGSTSSTWFPGTSLKLDAKTGKTLWKRPLPSRAESSPLVIDRTVYFGCEDGNLYALSTRNGNVRWATGARRRGQVGAGLLRRQALRRRLRRLHERGRREEGKLLWQSGSLGPGFGGTGAFYSTPAVAFGRVYAGNNDARVYSFGSPTATSPGATRPAATPTPARRWPAPAIARPRSSSAPSTATSTRSTPRMAAALDPAAGGQVIGSLSAVGDIVYVAEFENNTTTG